MRSLPLLLLVFWLHLSTAFGQANYHQTVYEPTNFDGLRAAPAHCADGSVLLLTKKWTTRRSEHKHRPFGRCDLSPVEPGDAGQCPGLHLPSDHPWNIESTSRWWGGHSL
ncbi:MAG: hypothetical protein IPG69_09665 [Flavobacteriales bacterium]|nr:hypothetical protein [Flavobacteriales bacterium]